MPSAKSIDEELRLMGQVVDAEASLRAKADRIIALMIESIGSYGTSRTVGLEIVPVEGERWLASVACPMGKGRLILAWGAQGRNLQASLVAEREQYDQYGRQFWEPVWAVTIPQQEDPFVVRGDGQEGIFFDFSYGENLPYSAKKAAISMIHAIVLGGENAK